MEDDYGAKIYNIIKTRKSQLSEVLKIIDDGSGYNDNQFLHMIKMHSVNVDERISTEDREEIRRNMENFVLLGSFLGSIIEMKNTHEKLILFLEIVKDFNHYVTSRGKARLITKYRITEIPRISIAPPKLSLDVQLTRGPTSSLKINGEDFQEGERVILRQMNLQSKVIRLPAKPNFCLIIKGLIDMIELLYNVFVDRFQEPAKVFDILTKIDELLHKNVFNFLNKICFGAAEVQLKKEFAKLYSFAVSYTHLTLPTIYSV
eukprot:TRINITY_DN8918_c0_g1_i1.p1 TRINITY_DN8918_c0_g1~~TRINITY_DN8918_c0_g1_i1.p1  ORF type:complete len:261 (-),score=57.32 TRINITY_DN8918_c0_g1_i1:34-816(-)